MDVRNSPERKALSTLGNSNTQPVPVSPTANLKLLTSVASELGDTLPGKRVNGNQHCLREPDGKTRKDKSLGILCDKFLAMFPMNLPVDCELLEICLDRVSQQLGIVKRRIYDIINILESLQIASKVAKNRYYWHGSRNLAMTLSQLKSVGLRCGIDSKDIQAQQRGSLRLVSGPACCHMKSLPVVCSAPAVTDHEYLKTENQSSFRDDFFCDERSLGVMCQKFMMLFLVSPQCGAVINLDLATRMLVSEAAESESERQLWGNVLQCHKVEGDEDCSRSSKDCRCLLRLKTKVRRLYDIANVLTSLGLIAKMENPPNFMRKPAFYYTGPVVEAASSISSITSANIRQSLLSSFCVEEDEGMENKRKILPYKRKNNLSKNGPPEKLPRTSSENALGQRKYISGTGNHQQFSVRHGDSSLSVVPGKCLQFKSSLLQVAEQEFEKLCSSEGSAPSESIATARKKLSFSRCHSDSCIQSQSTNFGSNFQLNDINARDQNSKLNPESISSKSVVPPSTAVRKSICITVSDLKNKKFTITRKLVEVPSHLLSQKRTQDLSLKVSKAQGHCLDTSLILTSEKGQSSDVFNASSTSDILNNNKVVVPSMSSSQDNSVGVSTSLKSESGPVPTIASGELYQAIRVGNVLRLVPLHAYLKNMSSGQTK